MRVKQPQTGMLEINGLVPICKTERGPDAVVHGRTHVTNNISAKMWRNEAAGRFAMALRMYYGLLGAIGIRGWPCRFLTRFTRSSSCGSHLENHPMR
ncbi:protein of unknown function [Aminobacter niigataensis]|nr:protein of unknown function [Aminobacter niigataensis]